MQTFTRLAITLAATLALAAAATTAGAADCQTKRNNSCAQPGASCGPKREKGFCQTIRRRTYRDVDIHCGCHPRVFIH